MSWYPRVSRRIGRDCRMRALAILASGCAISISYRWWRSNSRCLSEGSCSTTWNVMALRPGATNCQPCWTRKFSKSAHGDLRVLASGFVGAAGDRANGRRSEQFRRHNFQRRRRFPKRVAKIGCFGSIRGAKGPFDVCGVSY